MPARAHSVRPSGTGPRATVARRITLVVAAICLVQLAAAGAWAQPAGKLAPGKAVAGKAVRGKAVAGAKPARLKAPLGSRRARLVRRAKAIKHSLGETRIVASAGIRTGLVVVAGAGTDVGVVLRPRAESKAPGRRRLAVYQAVGGNLGPVGGKGYLGSDRQLRGFEYNIGPASRRSPVHGDKIGVPIIPGVLSVSASRKGGLGVHVSALPVPLGVYPLVWGNASVYVGHPKLAPVSNRVLDAADAIGRRVVAAGERLGQAARTLTRLFSRRSAR